MTEKEKTKARRRLAVCYSLLATPFEEDGGVDWFSFERLLEWQKEAGCTGVGIGFLSGEGEALKEEEYGEMVGRAALCLGGRIPLVAGCIAPCTEQAVRLARIAYDEGANALYCPPPRGIFSFAPGYFGHLLAIASAVPLPLFATRSTGKSALRLCAEQLEIEGVLGVAETGASFFESQLLRRETPSDHLLLAARDSLLFPFGCLGFDGALSPVACLYPQAVKDIFEGVRQGRLERARQIQSALLPLCALAEGQEGTALLKWALHRRGLCTPAMRLPLALPDDSLLCAFEKRCLEFERAYKLCFE